ncbi:MAG TPA: alanine--tRNA ligase [Candidatus Babeliales bacterium]|jgi:alanyl-tRNA synthetase|nr:alanine--tRNA ligase [Candidatus Babeliales bacterium]
MQGSVIRKKFIDFFVNRKHEYVASSSLIPAQDPTILFANAGMNQFKDLFLGLEKRSYNKAVSIQKCVRAGGKHNDLENVGFTKRHLTFFEMMGNFSFGDYFKQEAITYAWDFLVNHIQLDPDKLHASVHHTDDQAYDIWKSQIGLPAHKIHRLGDADNFWQMGDVGPCGPCSEIYIDRGISFGCGDEDTCSPACGCDRFLEIWNLVFMQYDRQSDGTLKELSQKGVDTGMGFERLCAVVQDKDSVFAIDVFAPIIAAIEKHTGIDYSMASSDIKPAFHVLADHIRSCTFLIADGCAPSNEGRGYVLRKIIRRAALFAQKLSNDVTLFPSLSDAVIAQMESIYPELRINQRLIHEVLTSEVERFSANLIRGTAILAAFFAQNVQSKTISGKDAFTLYDTYGFPLELTTAAARERGYTVDTDAYEECMEKQKQQSGADKQTNKIEDITLEPPIRTEFTGYHELQTTSTIAALIQNGHTVDAVDAGSHCFVITKQSPFFIVGGGQVPDQGWLVYKDQKTPILSVRFMQKAIAAECIAPAQMHVGDSITSIVDKELRTNAMKNHTATHVLQSALIRLFGKHIKQSGSVVHPDYLRFDFTYHTQLSTDDIIEIENLVNEKIRENIPVTIDHMTLKDATQQGVIAFFGDKYNPDDVRVVQVSDFSAELCGGTHVQRTGDIGTFKIIEVTSPAAGLRRIVALTGPKAIEHYQTMYTIAKGLSQEFSVKPEEVPAVVLKQKEELRSLQKKIHTMQHALLIAKVPMWKKQTQTIADIPTLCIMEDNLSLQQMRDILTVLMQQTPGIYCIISNDEQKASFIVRIASEYMAHIDAVALKQWLQNEYNLKSGGKAGELQGGGPIIPLAFAQAVYDWIKHNRK